MARILMFWVMVVMVPISLLIGILAGMREGSRTDRTLSVASITTTATPEYVSGVIFTVIFASWLGWLNGSAASATGQGITFYNFTLPVLPPLLCRALLAVPSATSLVTLSATMRPNTHRFPYLQRERLEWVAWVWVACVY